MDTPRRTESTGNRLACPVCGNAPEFTGVIYGEGYRKCRHLTPGNGRCGALLHWKAPGDGTVTVYLIDERTRTRLELRASKGMVRRLKRPPGTKVVDQTGEGL